MKDVSGNGRKEAFFVVENFHKGLKSKMHRQDLPFSYAHVSTFLEHPIKILLLLSGVIRIHQPYQVKGVFLVTENGKVFLL